MTKRITFGEIEVVESITKAPFNEPTGLGLYMAAICYVLKKRTDSEFTLEMAKDMDSRELGAFVEPFLDDGDDENPKGK